MTLRPWQSEAIPIAATALRSGRRCVLQAATGAGKTRLVTELVRDLDVKITVPTQALVEQTWEALRAAGVDAGRWYADEHEDARVMVVCHDSLSSAPPRPYWIADECHKVTFDVECVGRLGLTATPYPPGKGALAGWDELVYAYPIERALADGVLVGFDVIRSPDESTTALEDMLRTTPPEGPGAVSAFSIADAEEYADVLASLGLRAAGVHSRQSRGTRSSTLARLRDGALDVVVFPELLSEGVDLPWLRWLGLRRRVHRRRLVQQVGRVVRCWPGKDRARVYDPHDLLALHGLVHTAALGAVPPDEQEEEDIPDDWPVFELPPLNRELPTSVAVDAMGAWVRDLVLAMELGQYQDGDPWRREPCSPKQAEALTRLKWTTRFLPEEHRPAVNVLVRRASVLRRGVASDLLSVLMQTAKHARPWIERMKASGRDPWRMKAPVVDVPVPVVPVRVVRKVERAP